MLYLSGVDQWWGTRRETMRFTAINSDKTYNMLPEDFYTCVQHGQVYSQGEGLELNMSGNFWKCKYGFLRPGDSIN